MNAETIAKAGSVNNDGPTKHNINNKKHEMSNLEKVADVVRGSNDRKQKKYVNQHFYYTDRAILSLLHKQSLNTQRLELLVGREYIIDNIEFKLHRCFVKKQGYHFIKQALIEVNNKLLRDVKVHVKRGSRSLLINDAHADDDTDSGFIGELSIDELSIDDLGSLGPKDIAGVPRSSNTDSEKDFFIDDSNIFFGWIFNPYNFVSNMEDDHYSIKLIDCVDGDGT